MTIYRHRENQLLYTIGHLVLDIYHLNCNAFAGIYAQPYNWKGEDIVLRSKSKEVCEQFMDDNFEKVSEV